MNTNKSIVTIIKMLCVGIIGSSCTKENLKYNDTTIQSFKYVDAIGQSQQAAIGGDSIFIYWTPLQEVLETIIPEINIHHTSRIAPASGEAISLKTGEKYTVTAENGAQKTYFISLKINQPYPYISSLLPLSSARGNKFWQNHQNLTLTGDFFEVDGQETKVWGVNGSGEKVPVEIVSNNGVKLVLSPLQKGVYQFFLEVGMRTLAFPDPIEIVDPIVLPSLKRPEAAAKIPLKRGDTYTFEGVDTDKVKEITIGDFTVQTPIEIVSSAENTITIKIPETFALGEYTMLYAVYEEGPYYNEGRAMLLLGGTRAIVVTE